MNVRDDNKVLKQGVEKLNALVKSRDEQITNRKECEKQIDKINTNIQNSLVDTFLPVAKLKKVSLIVEFYPKEGILHFSVFITPEPIVAFHSHMLGVYTVNVDWRNLSNVDIKMMKTNLLTNISKLKVNSGLIPIVPDGIVRAHIKANTKYF